MKKLMMTIFLSAIALTLGIPKTDVVIAGGGIIECPACIKPPSRN